MKTEEGARVLTLHSVGSQCGGADTLQQVQTRTLRSMILKLQKFYRLLVQISDTNKAI